MFRANKRPKDNDDNYTVFIAFQYPDERNEYRLSLKDFGPPGTELTSSLKVGKSRNFILLLNILNIYYSKFNKDISGLIIKNKFTHNRVFRDSNYFK